MFLGSWLDLVMAKKKEVEKINILIKKATSLQNEENYFDAYSLWDDVVTELNKLIESTKTARVITKVAGWAATIATFGIGPEDLIIVPIINKALLWLFDVDLDFVLGRMSLAMRQRQVCLYHDEKLIKVSVFKEELTYFAYSYTVSNSIEDNQQKVNKILNLLNPFHKTSSLRFTKTEPELYEEIVHIIENGRITKEIRLLNEYLISYLQLKQKTNNILYQALKNSN